MGIFLNLLNKLVCLRLDGLAVINILLSPNIAPLIDGTLDMADEVLTGPHLLIDNLDYIFLNLNQRYEGMTRVNMGDNAFWAEHWDWVTVTYKLGLSLMSRALPKLCLISLLCLLLCQVECHAVLNIPVSANTFDWIIFVNLLIERANHGLILQGLRHAFLAECVTTVQNKRLPCLIIVGV